MIRPGFALLLLAMLWLGASPVRAQDTIWGAVLLASNAAQPSETPPELRGLAERLGRIFGYNQWVVLGSSTEKIDDQVERMLIPTKHFSLNVKARRASSKEARLSAESHALSGQASDRGYIRQAGAGEPSVYPRPDACARAVGDRAKSAAVGLAAPWRRVGSAGLSVA
jgi:hypothetical protein